VWSQQRDPESYAKLLEGAERVAKLQVPRVVAALEVRPGMRVADLGSGSGLFTRPLARAVGDAGTVYAVDIDEGMLKIVVRSAVEQKIANIRTVLATPDDPKLPEPVDLVFICDTLHHITGQGAYLKTLRKYLKPGGRVAVIDFGAQWPQGHESFRYGTGELDAWMTAAGFARSAEHDFLDNSFFLIYR
jgi:ubiquinone/menaquinone biosynthesis C-methylase UbiE